MSLVILCGVLLAAGIAMTIAWSGESVHPPAGAMPGLDAAASRGRLGALRAYAWWAGLLTLTGTATGLLIAGAGGRLAMRLLALTSPASNGRFTEGQAVVGEISVTGTLAFLTFGALPIAFLSTGLYLVVQPWLPRGRWGGLAFGALLLVALAPVVDPLRPENRDFDLLGPGWLSVLVFAALALAQGAAIAAMAGRASRALPLIAPGARLRGAAPLPLAVALLPVGIVLAAGALAVAAAPRAFVWLLSVRRAPRVVLGARIALVLIGLATLPAFVAAVVSITTG